MKRRAWLNRRTPLRPVNPERRARLREEQFGSQADACRSSPCVGCGWPPGERDPWTGRVRPIDPAHVRSRGAGGLDRDTVPLCRRCHLQQHAWGIQTFQTRKRVDLHAEAARLAAIYHPDPPETS